MDTSDALLAARDLIADRGWAQGVYEAGDGRLCLRGAVNLATYGVAAPNVAGESSHCEALRLYCWDAYGCGAMTLNDRLLSSPEEARQVLDNAARWVKEGEKQPCR